MATLTKAVCNAAQQPIHGIVQLKLKNQILDIKGCESFSVLNSGTLISVTNTRQLFGRTLLGWVLLSKNFYCMYVHINFKSKFQKSRQRDTSKTSKKVSKGESASGTGTAIEKKATEKDYN